MIPDELGSRDELGLEEYAVTPSADDMRPESEAFAEAEADLRSRLDRGARTVAVTHNDADGLGSAAMIQAHASGPAVLCPVGHNGAYQAHDALAELAMRDLSGVDVHVADLGVEVDPDDLRRIAESADSASWWDHHRWDDEWRETVEEAGWDVAVDESICATKLLHWKLHDGEAGLLSRLAELTNDHDMWIHNVPGSKILGAAAQVLNWESYVDAVVSGELPTEGETGEIVRDWMSLQEELEAEAVRTADVTQFGHLDVAFTYTRAARTSEVGNELAEGPIGADIAVVMGTDGSVHVYSHSNEKGFDRCHEVARELGGGGHRTAAGATFDFEDFRELSGYWTGLGSNKRIVVVEALMGVAGE